MPLVQAMLRLLNIAILLYYTNFKRNGPISIYCPIYIPIFCIYPSSNTLYPPKSLSNIYPSSGHVIWVTVSVNNCFDWLAADVPESRLDLFSSSVPLRGVDDDQPVWSFQHDTVGHGISNSHVHSFRHLENNQAVEIIII